MGLDGALTCDFLTHTEIEARSFVDCHELCREIERGAGALILAEEVVSHPDSGTLRTLLASQPPWSDIPVIVVADRAQHDGKLTRIFDDFGGVSVLHRPLSADTLCSTVDAALRARTRQYEVRDLLRQRDEAEKRREEFLAMLAHELRNPLAPIRTGLQVLRLTESQDTVTRTRAMIERQVANLTRLIDDLLNVSRITRGKIHLKKEMVNVLDVLTQAVDGRARLATEKGLRIDIVRPPDGAQVCVEADSTRLEQMIDNLLTNAIKFTPDNGSIQLEASQEGTHAVIRVRDSGIGIPPQILPRVFDLFAQADRPLDRSQGGLGIGLTVVKTLAELHGGTAQAFSEGEGKGTEIVIRLPAVSGAAMCAHQRVQRLNRGPFRPARVLVIEDNRDAADVLATYLRTRGHFVQVAYDGDSGLSAALRERPDVVVCDIGLPGMDGYQLARALRADGLQSTLVAVTGYGEPRDRERGRHAGFQHYLVKPADPEELARLLTNAVHAQHPLPSPAG
jgi:signal transduction histidine kinase/ActR/RegA family two-component response regulator